MTFLRCDFRLRAAVILVMLVGSAGVARPADATGLLREAIERWSHERDSWAFTQTVREFDGDTVQHVRIERYDPSRGEAQRWTLVTVDGRPPTTEETGAFQQRKGLKRKRRPGRSPSDFVDFEKVTIQAETPEAIAYLVPVREDVNRLVPVEKLSVIVTVDRHTRAVRRLAITLADPLKIAFGLARVTDMNFDLRFEFADGADPATPEHTQPVGTARATMHKFGDRAEFTWSDFVRVGPPEDGKMDR